VQLGSNVVGVTDANGMADVTVPLGSYTVQVCLCPSYSGSENFVVAQQGEVVERLILLTPTGQ
jgi:hypothetical protein